MNLSEADEYAVMGASTILIKPKDRPAAATLPGALRVDVAANERGDQARLTKDHRTASPSPNGPRSAGARATRSLQATWCWPASG